MILCLELNHLRVETAPYTAYALPSPIHNASAGTFTGAPRPQHCLGNDLLRRLGYLLRRSENMSAVLLKLVPAILKFQNCVRYQPSSQRTHEMGHQFFPLEARRTKATDSVGLWGFSETRFRLLRFFFMSRTVWFEILLRTLLWLEFSEEAQRWMNF